MMSHTLPTSAQINLQQSEINQQHNPIGGHPMIKCGSILKMHRRDSIIRGTFDIFKKSQKK